MNIMYSSSKNNKVAENLCPNRAKQIQIFEQFDEKRKKNLENLIKKNQKYKDIFQMIGKNNYFSNIFKDFNRRVFSEKKINLLNEDINSYKEIRKKRKKEEKIKDVLKEIGNFHKNTSFDLNYKSDEKPNLIDLINIKPQYGLSFRTYSTYFDSKIDLKIEDDSNLKFLKDNNLKKKNLKKDSFFSPPSRNLTEKDIKRWVIQQKFGLKEPFYVDNDGNINNIDSLNKSKQTKDNNNNSILQKKPNIKSNIYYSNDFFNIQLENFENNLNKIGKRYLKKETRTNTRKRLLTP